MCIPQSRNEESAFASHDARILWNARRSRHDCSNPLSFNHDVLVWLDPVVAGLTTVTSEMIRVCGVCAAFVSSATRQTIPDLATIDICLLEPKLWQFDTMK